MKKVKRNLHTKLLDEDYKFMEKLAEEQGFFFLNEVIEFLINSYKKYGQKQTKFMNFRDLWFQLIEEEQEKNIPVGCPFAMTIIDLIRKENKNDGLS